MDSKSRVKERVTVASRKINLSLFANDLVLLVSFQQPLPFWGRHALDRLTAPRDQAGMKISTKIRSYNVFQDKQASAPCK